MTEWQWSVILALIRFTFLGCGRYIYTTDEYGKDMDILNEALRRDIEAKKEMG